MKAQLKRSFIVVVSLELRSPKNPGRQLIFVGSIADYGLGISQVPSPALAEEGEVTFWNANAWEGQEVKVMRITMRR